MKTMEVRQGSDSGDDTQRILPDSSNEETVAKRTHRLIVLGVLLLLVLPLLIATIILSLEDKTGSCNSEGIMGAILLLQR